MTRNSRGHVADIGYIAGFDTEFCVRHVPHLRQRLLRMGVTQADVDDLVQSTFVVAQVEWEWRPRGRRKQRNWVNGIAWRLAMNWRRSVHRRYERCASESLDMFAAEEVDLDARLDAQRLYATIVADLRASDRSLLMSYYVDEVPLTELAARHGLARSTAWTRLQHLRQDVVERIARRRR